MRGTLESPQCLGLWIFNIPVLHRHLINQPFRILSLSLTFLETSIPTGVESSYPFPGSLVCAHTCICAYCEGAEHMYAKVMWKTEDSFVEWLLLPMCGSRH